MIKEEEKLATNSPLLPLLVAIFCFGLGYLVIYPKISELKNLNTQIAAVNKDSINLQEKTSNLKILQSKFARASSDVELLKVALPADEQMAEIIQQLQTLASKSGMLVKSIRPSIGPVSDETLLAVSLEGTFSNLVTFSENLEKNVRPANIKSVNMASSDSLTGTIFEANVTLAFFTNQDKNASANQQASSVSEEEK